MSKTPVGLWFAACGVFTLAAGCAQKETHVDCLPSEAENSSVLVHSGNESYNFISGVSKTSLHETPRWEAGQPYPPLSAARAIEAAETVRARFHSRGLTAANHLEGVSLVPCHGTEGMWVWVVLFKWKDFDELKIVVLMDGRAVEPQFVEDYDNGIPLKHAPPPEPATGRPPLELIDEFVRHLHDDRRFLGQIIMVEGIVEDLPIGDPEAIRLRQWYRLKLDNGQSLICDPPGGWLYPVPKEKLMMKVQLVGFKDASENGKNPDEFSLTPGIRILEISPIEWD